MADYYCPYSNATGSTVALAQLRATASIRPLCTGLVIGFSSTPDDRAINLSLKRHTAVGTGGTQVAASTIPRNDPASPDPSCGFYRGTWSPQPTLEAEGMSIPIYQRATLRFVMDYKCEIQSAAGTANGLTLNSEGVQPSGTPTAAGTFFWRE